MGEEILQQGREMPGMPVVRSVVCAGSAILLASGCAGPDAGTDEPARWATVPLWEASGEATVFEDVAGVALLDDGGMVVVDEGPPILRVIDASGAVVRSVGVLGEGPGDFERPAGVWVTPDRRIGVWDSGLRRMSWFDLDLTLLTTRPVDGRPDPFHGVLPDGSLLLGTLNFGDADAGPYVPDRWIVQRVDSAGGSDDLVELRGFRRLDRDPLPWFSAPLVRVFGDSLLTADGGTMEIAVRDRSGAVGRVIALEGARPDAAALERDLEATLIAEADSFNLSKLPLVAEHLDDLPALAGLVVDPAGYLWVRRFTDPEDGLWLKRDAMRPAPGGRWEVTHPDGRLAAVVELPSDFVLFEVQGDLLAGVSIDALDVERPALLRLDRAGEAP